MASSSSHVLETLSDLNSKLGEGLKALKSIGPHLFDILHHDERLPRPEHVRLAAQAVNTLQEIQVMLDPLALLITGHFLGYTRSKCLLAAVRRGIPDVLARRPIGLAELAQTTGAQESGLSQVLCPLPASTLLVSSHWTQWHNWVTLYCDQFFDMASGIPEAISVVASRSAVQIAFNTDENMFEFFRQQGWVPPLHRTLGLPGILEDYPWDEVAKGLVMDIGGGAGDFLVGLLRKHSRMQGEAGGRFNDVAKQIQSHDILSGNFLESVRRCEVYTMKWCIRDWNDAQVMTVLRDLRSSVVLGPKSRLIVLESVLSAKHSDRLATYGDLNMMMTINGQERTAEDWRRLAIASGRRVNRLFELRRACVKALEFLPVLHS
ncbi:S-adenosyl-L-methionine-dependent methyltransferase [Xylariaceae sp. AK1471]|nr:S-adenosyl-L-methionine-dependent methyltransferase [Xylariaceae sp. AK1471]